MWLKLASCLTIIFLAIEGMEAQERLVRKLTEGRKLVYQMESKFEQTLTLAGMDLETKSNVFMRLEQTTGPRSADGTIRETEKLLSLQVDLQLPGGIQVGFDSSNPDKPAPIAELEPVLKLFRVMSQTPTTMVYDQNNELKEVEFPAEKLASLDEPLRKDLEPEKRKKQHQVEWAFLPSEPVKAGDKWERSEESNLGGGQTFSFLTEYHYAGPVEKNGLRLHRILPKPLTVSYAMEQQPGSPLKVVQSELSVTESQGEILFDAQRGVLHSRTQKLRIVGPMTISISGQELPAKLDLKIFQKAELQP